MTARSREVEALYDVLLATGRVKVGLRDLWSLWAGAAPRLVGLPDQTRALHGALEALAADSRVELPAASWDRSTVPPLPAWVKVAANRRSPRNRAWRHFAWCAEMGWVASQPSLSDERFEDLVRVHEWLVSNRSASVLPVRYRSVELFGDEKHLERLARTTLFGPGHLTFDLLRCRRLPPPLPAIPVGDGPDVLVIENSDPYWVAAEVLASIRGHPIRAVAWGSGAAFPAQVETLGVDIAGGGPVSGVVWYWGDLDPRGASIGAEAAAASSSNAGIPIRPADGLWKAMACCRHQDAGAIAWPDQPAVATWFGPTLWTDLHPVRDAKARIAQEALLPEAVASWVTTIPRP